MKHKTIAVDIAKNVFEIAVSDKPGRVSRRHRLSRARFLRFFATLEPATVLFEACGSAHFWGRELRKFGHTVMLLPPHLVRPFAVTTNTTEPTPRPSSRPIVTRRFSRFLSRRSNNRLLPLCIDFAQPGWTPALPASTPCENYYESSASSFPKEPTMSCRRSTGSSKTQNRDFPML